MSKNIIKRASGVGLGMAAWMMAAAPAMAATTGLAGGASSAKATEAVTDLTTIISTVVNVMFTFIGIAAVIFMIIGGLSYITSQGDKTKVENAKNTIMYSVIGVVVAIASYAIVQYVISQFAGKK